MKNEKNTTEVEKVLEKVLATYDKEFYYHILLLPKKYHKSLILLRSFNLDLACIFAKASNAQAGMIRLQWWEDVIMETNSPWRGQQIKNSLQDMILAEIHEGNLHKNYLLHMINARRLEFNIDNFNTTSEFYDYVENVSSPYFYHVFQSLDITINADIMKIIHMTGRAWGITSIMRGMAFFKAQNRSVFSMEQLQAFQIDSPALIHHDSFSEKNKLLMQSLVIEVKNYLNTIENSMSTYVSSLPTYESNKQTKRKLKKALIPLVFVKDYLKEIIALDFNVYNIDHNKRHIITLIKTCFLGL